MVRPTYPAIAYIHPYLIFHIEDSTYRLFTERGVGGKFHMTSFEVNSMTVYHSSK